MKEEKGYRAFCEYARGKSFSLIGLGVSNLPLVPYLYQAGADSVVVRDLKKKADDADVLKAKEAGAAVILGASYLEGLNEDVVIRSPGIRPDIPAFCKARNSGSRITCETELFLQFVPCRTFAVTGSDGKTTTTTLISKILERAGGNVYLGGNIGKAMLPQLDGMKASDYAVMELSSFQLMHCHYSPDVAVITNLAENHLDWHTDMAEYLEAKKNILFYQDKESVSVLNADNQHTSRCLANGLMRRFSYIEKGDEPEWSDGVFCRDGCIFIKKNGQTSPYFETSHILLPGKHNVENYMAAIAATLDFASMENVLAVAESFGGVEHRIELVRRLDGVSYYNSSIDSSPSRSCAALNAFSQKLIMIAGGYDKNLDYTSLGDAICQKVKVLILCGATSEKIRVATESSRHYNAQDLQIICCREFSETVPCARSVATPGDVVILSPASASFDLFRNFEERGKYFKKLVTEL